MFRRLDSDGGEPVNVTINGRHAQARRGETVAAAVLAQGLTHSRSTPVSGAPRAPFCMMGACFDCLMIIDGRPNQRACMEQVREGMRIEYQPGAGTAP